MARTKKTPDKVVGQVFETTDLNQFKLLKGNRMVAISQKLRKSVIDKGVVTPIKVNSKMEVVDGQHRLALAKELHLPIKYEFDNSDISVAELNSTSRAWNLSDFVNQYNTLGYKEFRQLVSLLSEYSALRLTPTIAQAQGGSGSSHRRNSSVRDGSFKFKNYKEYEKFASSYQRFIDTTKVRTNTSIQNAYFILYATSTFNPTRFIKKVNARGLADSLYGVSSLPRVLRAFVEANNSGLSPKSPNWITMTTNQLGNIIVETPVNKKLVDTIGEIGAK